MSKAKAYRKRTDRWGVRLWWEGKDYRRSHYDDVHPLYNQDMASQIAAAVNNDIKESLERKVPFDPRKWFKTTDMTFSAWVDVWLPQTDYSPSVAWNMKTHVEEFRAFFGEMNLIHIAEEHIIEFHGTLKTRGLSDNYRKTLLAYLHKIMADGYRHFRIRSNLPYFPSVSIPKMPVEYLERDEQDKVISKIPERDQPIFQFIRNYGCRPGEARALMWDAVNWKRKTVTFRRNFSRGIFVEHTKTNLIRTLPFTEQVEKILRAKPGIAGYVFLNSKGRYYQNLPRIWHKACAQVGIKIDLYHGTRHSLASQLVSQGHSLEIIKEVLGHTDISMTQRYTRANLEALKGVL